MKILVWACLLSVVSALNAQTQASLPPPSFHHLHLNSLDPDAAIAFYVRQFPSTAKSSYAGLPALKAGNVYVLFTKVNAPPPTAPQTAIWHFGWHVVDEHQSLATFQQRKDVHLLPLYTSDEGGTVFVSSDTWPGFNGSLGRTKAQIADAKAQGIQPTHVAGFGYLEGPDGALIEYQGDMPVERFNHVHLFEKDPFCAQLWYQQHLNAPPPAGGKQAALTEANCKVPRPELSWPSLERAGMLRQPAGVTFSDVALTWHVPQDERPLAGTRGHLYDHIGLGVANLDAWIAKLRGEGVKFLEQPYPLGDTRAIMIEGPSGEALELIQVQ
jgi:catechol 2,3-dioxygenase-like lactoylglutathione lyase family enzyme